MPPEPHIEQVMTTKGEKRFTERSLLASAAHRDSQLT